MSFRVGDKVVYPHHGAAIIESVEQKEMFGEKRKYYILKLAYGELTLMVPTDATEDVGLYIRALTAFLSPQGRLPA